MRRVLSIVATALMVTNCGTSPQRTNCEVAFDTRRMTNLQVEGLYPRTTISGLSPSLDRDQYDQFAGVFVVVKCGDKKVYMPVWTAAGEGGAEQNCAGFLLRRIIEQYGIEWGFPGDVWLNDLDSMVSLLNLTHTKVVLEGVKPQLVAESIPLYTLEQINELANQLNIGDRIVVFSVQNFIPSKLFSPMHFAEFIGFDENGKALFLNDNGESIEEVNSLNQMAHLHGGHISDSGEGYPGGLFALYRPKDNLRISIDVEFPEVNVRPVPVG